MFEYLLDPRDVCSIRDISFTFDELERIEDVTTNIMSDDYEFQGFLESYEDPFWTVYSIPSKKKLKLEIHAVIDDGDDEWLKEKFAEYVKRAFELILEEALMKPQVEFIKNGCYGSHVKFIKNGYHGSGENTNDL